jgi:hypothetical protein
MKKKFNAVWLFQIANFRFLWHSETETTEPTPAPIRNKTTELPENGIAIELMDKSVRRKTIFTNT